MPALARRTTMDATDNTPLSDASRGRVCSAVVAVFASRTTQQTAAQRGGLASAGVGQARLAVDGRGALIRSWLTARNDEMLAQHHGMDPGALIAKVGKWALLTYLSFVHHDDLVNEIEIA
jgi:hypothetical protein